MRGQAFGVFTLIGFVVVFASFVLLLPFIQSFSTELCPLIDGTACFFLQITPGILLLSGLAAVVMFAGNWSQGNFGA